MGRDYDGRRVEQAIQMCVRGSPCVCVRFQVLKAKNMMMAVFLGVAPCSLVDIDWR
jgi:hypothetical protein